MKQKPKLKQFAVAGVCVLAIAFIPNWEHKINQLHRLQVLGSNTQNYSDVNPAPELVAVKEMPVITAKSALAYDFQSGSILFTQNFDDKLPIASLTKLMSALVVMDSGKLNELIEVKESDTKVIGPYLGIVVGEKISVMDALKSMLIASHNDAALALTRHVAGSMEQFVNLMNAKAVHLGLQNTHFTNSIGFDDYYHYSTAHDLSIVLREFLSNPDLVQIVRTKEVEVQPKNLNFSHKVKSTNKLLLENENIIGVKTGYTTEAKGNLVIRSIENNTDVVTIVLGSDDREGDTRKILDWIYTVYKW